jgi:hypothetical protein
MSRLRVAPPLPPSKADSTSARAGAANARAIATARKRAARDDELRKPPFVLTARTRKRFSGIGSRRRGTASQMPLDRRDLPRRRTKSLIPRTARETARRHISPDRKIFSSARSIRLDAMAARLPAGRRRPENRIPRRLTGRRRKARPPRGALRPLYRGRRARFRAGAAARRAPPWRPRTWRSVRYAGAPTRPRFLRERSVRGRASLVPLRARFVALRRSWPVATALLFRPPRERTHFPQHDCRQER